MTAATDRSCVIPATRGVPTPEVEVSWLGRVPYRATHERQRVRREAVIAGGQEAFWLLEHDPVITTGRRDAGALDAVALKAAGIDLVATERGGLATWHGPGQLVGYLIVDLARRRLGVRTMVCAIEQGLIDWLAGQGVAAGRRTSFPGVWVGRDKIAAIGLHFRQGVSLHGFALNLTNGRDGFDRIVPCGITDGGVTRLADHLAGAPSPLEAHPGVASAVSDALARAAR